MKVDIQSRSGKTIATLDVEPETTVQELKRKFHAVKKAYYPSRQRFTLPLQAGEARPKALDDESKSLQEYGLTQGGALVFKDLGPQIGYATVFFWEYFGPLAVYPLFYLLPQYIYGKSVTPAERPLAQTLALAYWSFHYTKRIVETFTVHRFGHATMPVANLFRNCAYYWGFAAFVSYFVNHPLYTAPAELQTYVALGLALLCLFGNLWSHIILSRLRGPNDKGYKIPRGFLFNYVTCANYTFELWGWILYTIAVQALPAAVFTLVGGAQMAAWAVKKHARLRKTFDGKDGRPKYPRRWIMIPPFF